MATILDTLRSSIDPAKLGLGNINFARPAEDVRGFASELGQQLGAYWQRQTGGAPLDPARLRGLLPAVADPAPATPGKPYSAIYSFGDSLSDTGNVSAATGGLAPAAPYADGNFSNGPVWVEHLAARLGLALPQPSLQGGTNFAYGGAETGGTAVHAETPIDLPGQLLQFRAQVQSPRPDALYTVWAGGNDLMDAVRASSTNPQAAQQAVGQAVANVDRMVEGLADSGARNFLVLTVPDLGKTPYETSGGPQQAATASALSQQFNSGLQAALAETAQSRQLQIDLVDSSGLLQTAAANPAVYGFTNVTDPVWTGSYTAGSTGTLAATGTVQNQYVFFDKLHPTTAAHAVVAQAAANALAT